MASTTRSSAPAVLLAAISLLLAVVGGIEWLGKPLRLVHLLTIIGLSMTAGVSWAQAAASIRRDRRRQTDALAIETEQREPDSVSR